MLMFLKRVEDWTGALHKRYNSSCRDSGGYPLDHTEPRYRRRDDIIGTVIHGRSVSGGIACISSELLEIQEYDTRSAFIWVRYGNIERLASFCLTQYF